MPLSDAQVLRTILPDRCHAPNSLRVMLENLIGGKGLEDLENQKWPRKNAETESLLKQLIDHDFNEMISKMDHKTLLKNTAIVLKYPEKKEKLTTFEEFTCPTCKKGFYNKRSLNGHRSKNKNCKIQWGVAKPPYDAVKTKIAARPSKMTDYLKITKNTTAITKTKT